ncbi:hypothetical protein LAZ67_22000664, partial [Cordylochernes scorpioides]
MNPLDQPSTSKGLGSEVHLDEDIQDILEYLYDSGSEIDDEVKDPDYENSASDELEFEEEEREEIPAKRPRLEVAPVRMLTTCRDTSTAAAGSNVAAGTWRKDDPSPPTPPPFTARPGLNLVGDVSSPFDAFSLFFTENIFKSIKEETNRYARSIIDRESKKGPLKPHGMLAKRKAVGRVGFRVYIKGKPHKYGIKIFQICEAVSGYAYNLDIYTGKDPEQPEHNSIPNLVDRLAKRFYGQGYHIYFDRWFSSPELFDKLWEKKTLAVGTVMPSRKTMPKTKFSQKLKRGEIIKMRRKHLLAIKWKDVRDVFMLSTVHEGKMMPVKPKTPTREELFKPDAVIDYNKGKDLHFISSFYTILHKMLSNADFLRDDNNIPNPDDEESETDDHIEERNWSTNTEQYTLSEEENNEDPSFNYYIGKDQKTKWKKALPPKNVRTRSENIITHLPGVKGEAKNAKSILDCWNLFIDDNILECIVTNTNVYIRNIQQNYSRERDAYLTNLHEIKALLGIIYFLGVMKANILNTDDAWARDSTGFELCRIAMSENRFRFLLRVIRFDDKATRNERLRQDKLAAVRLILDTFVKNCQKHYSPSEYITVDEKLDAFRGKCNFRQYIPSKHNKYGIKLFALVDSKMFYTCNLEIYSGKNPEGPYNVNNSPSDVVERLCEPIKGTGRNVTMVNWFTSYSLALELLHQYRLTIVGTLKINKKEIPSEIVDITRKQRRHCDDGDRLKFAAPPLLTLGHRVSHSMMQQKHSLWGLRRQQP